MASRPPLNEIVRALRRVNIQGSLFGQTIVASRVWTMTGSERSAAIESCASKLSCCFGRGALSS